MSQLKILYITSEIAPFLQTSTVASYVNRLAQDIHKKELDIRIFAPKFGTINERTNRLHEVIRLSRANITVGNLEQPLIVKATSIPNVRLQVYFIDNEIFFQRKATYYDGDHVFFEDNDIRSIFFCTGVLATLKKLEWSPNVVHCHDWFTSLIPMYLKTAYSHNAFFNQAKIITTLYNNKFDHKFYNITEKAKMMDMDDNALFSLSTGDFIGFIKTAIQYSDTVVRAESLIDPIFKKIFTGQYIPLIPSDAECAMVYYDLYNQ